MTTMTDNDEAIYAIDLSDKAPLSWVAFVGGKEVGCDVDFETLATSVSEKYPHEIPAFTFVVPTETALFV